MATTKNTQIGAAHFSANKAIYEIQRPNNFEFVIDSKLNNVTAYGYGSKSFPNAQDYIRLSISSAFLPHYSQSPIEIRRGNTSVKYAGVMSFDGGQITCNDFIGTETFDILAAWQALSGDPLNQTVGMAADYKMDCSVVEYTPDYSTIVRVWKLEGCWVNSLSKTDPSYESNNASQVTCQITYDRAYIDYASSNTDSAY